ncbi:hypothetical protein LAZ67_18002566 [Cordylochernes scorpioides]|uniref:Uncharacterized protein n=1 Tax=Cordylochernes scorpioides TaxID=51811 RepID=A0ABY6LH01_9ARAC|nr:hypothetical protein LAZ67_18002566 [Cordylochernes scorpioides]
MPRRSRPLIGRNTAASRRYRNARAIETPLQSETRRALRRLRYSEARVAATQTMQVPVQRIQLWTHKPFSGLEYNAYIDYKADSSVDIGQMSRVCQFCSALRLRDEPFSLCCKQGRVSLPAIEFPPEPIFSLLSGLHPLSKNTAASRRYRNARAIETPLQSETRRALRRLRYSEARVAATQTMQVPVQRIQFWTHKPFSGLEYNAHIDYKADSSVDIGQMSRVCQFCSALRFRDEPFSLCCKQGNRGNFVNNWLSGVFNKGHCNIFQSYCPNIHAERKKKERKTCRFKKATGSSLKDQIREYLSPYSVSPEVNLMDDTNNNSPVRGNLPLTRLCN